VIEIIVSHKQVDNIIAPPTNHVVIRYRDGDIWTYNINKLYKQTGPYSVTARQFINNSLASDDDEDDRVKYIKKGNRTDWWHYGVDKGSKILTKKKTNAAANPVPTQNTILSFSDDENSDDE